MNDELRRIENASIRAFVASCAPRLASGRVLDYGCGLSPYRALVTGDYIGYDDPRHPAYVAGGPSAPLNLFEGGPYDAVLCTQVIQYVPFPTSFLERLLFALRPGGSLVMTGPTNWPVVEAEDLWRLTTAGITALLIDAGFTIERCEVRASVEVLGNQFPLGWGVLARAS